MWVSQSIKRYQSEKLNHFVLFFVKTILSHLIVSVDYQIVRLKSLIFKIFSGIEARIHNPIPIEEFNDHVNHLRQENNKEFKLDFEVTSDKLFLNSTFEQSLFISKLLCATNVQT